MLDVRRLILLRELSLRGTITATAQSLNLTPSAVSQQLSQLEREAGRELLRKAGRRVKLTAAAELLVDAAGDVLNVMERAETSLDALSQQVQGRVRVAMFQSAALALLPDTLHIMAARYPQLRVEVVQYEPEQALWETWARDFDMVVAEQYPSHAAPRHPGLDRLDLISDAIRLALPPPAIAAAPPGHRASRDIAVSVADAADRPWVMEPRGTASRHFAEQLCRVHGFEPDVRYETADLQAHLRLVESGNAVALLPELVLTDRPTTCRLVQLPDDPRRTVFTAQRESGVNSPVTLALRGVLHEVAEALHSGGS